MTRYRALLGCATIAGIAVLGLPSLTEAATAGTQPPTTEAVSAEAPSDQQAADPDVNADAPVPPAPTETVPGEPQDEPASPAESADSAPAPVEPTTGDPTTDPAASSTEPPENASPAATESSAPSAPDTTTPDATTPATVPDVAEVATVGTATAAVTPSAATSAPTLETAINAEAPPSISLMAAAPQVYSLSATQTEDDYGTMKYRNVTISWSGTSDTTFEVERRLSTSSSWEWVGSSWDGSTSITDTFYDWSSFGWYQYRVTPSNYDYDTGYVYGTPSYASVNVTKVAYPPSLPRSVRVTRMSTTLQVTWIAPTTDDYYCDSTGYYYCDPATSYIVSWAPAGGAWQSVTTTSTSRTLSGLGAGTTYYVNVRAVNAAGRSGATTSIRVTPITKPAAMSQMIATPGNRQVTLRWTAPASNGSPVTRYAVQRRLATSATWTYISYNTPATATSFTALYLTNGTGYYFRIAALNAIGMGTWSSPVGAVPRTVPEAVSGLRSTSGSSTIWMSWNAPASNGGTMLRYYRVDIWNGSYWRALGTTSARSTTIYDFYGCTTFRVAAVNDAGTGAYRTIYKCGLTVPGAVGGLRATTGYHSLTLTWNAPSYGGRPSWYQVQAWNGWYWETKATTTWQSTTLYNGWGCQDYRVAAVNSAGTGWYSSLYACWR